MPHAETHMKPSPAQEYRSWYVKLYKQDKAEMVVSWFCFRWARGLFAYCIPNAATGNACRKVSHAPGPHWKRQMPLRSLFDAKIQGAKNKTLSAPKVQCAKNGPPEKVDLSFKKRVAPKLSKGSPWFSAPFLPCLIPTAPICVPKGRNRGGNLIPHRQMFTFHPHPVFEFRVWSDLTPDPSIPLCSQQLQPGLPAFVIVTMLWWSLIFAGNTCQFVPNFSKW